MLLPLRSVAGYCTGGFCTLSQVTPNREVSVAMKNRKCKVSQICLCRWNCSMFAFPCLKNVRLSSFFKFLFVFLFLFLVFGFPSFGFGMQHDQPVSCALFINAVTEWCMLGDRCRLKQNNTFSLASSPNRADELLRCSCHSSCSAPPHPSPSLAAFLPSLSFIWP